MGISEQIHEYLEKQADCITKKAEHREQHATACARLAVLMARHIDKSTASFENKIQLLLKKFEGTETEETIKSLSDSYYQDEALWKNYRDFAEVYKSKIIELQSQRKHEGSGL